MLQHSRYRSPFVVKALTSNLFGGNFSNATWSSKNKPINLRTILNSASVSDQELMRSTTGGSTNSLSTTYGANVIITCAICEWACSMNNEFGL